MSDISTGDVTKGPERDPWPDASGSEQGRPELVSRGRVLVVDDDPAVRRLASETLAEAGYRSLEAGDATEALRILAADPDIDVMVTDVRMPGEMNGYFLARRARERWPYVEIIMVSGYAAPDRRDIGFDCDVLVKPFKARDLLSRVAQRMRRIA
jgi:CheY-like chemotaxis protein